MGFIKENLSTLDMVLGVLPLLPPTVDEVRRCDIAALTAGTVAKEQVLHELFLLKASVACEYAQGLMETLGMQPAGLEQFVEIYVRRLGEGLAASFPSDPQKAVGLLGNRMKVYTAALHGQHPEDPHLALADAFTRFCGVADQPELVSLCLDTCKALNRAFLKELSELGLNVKE
jgi:hypothetical protein